MISRIVGRLSKKNIPTRVWVKGALALLLSNVFFFFLFSSPQDQVPRTTRTPGWVEISLGAHLLTPFEKGKKVLLVNRRERMKLEGEFVSELVDVQRIVILVKEQDAEHLFHHEGWEVMPFVRKLAFKKIASGENHEIRY